MLLAAEVPLLECRSIVKRFGGEVALNGVDFTLRAGEVHGLVGSNGAGKSTLMKILAGALPDHEGTVLLAGRPISLSSPLAARAHGIAMVYQELSGIAQLSVAENLCLGRQPTTRLGRIDWRGMRFQAREQLAELELDIDVDRRLDSYPLVVRQMVEIARGVHSGARVLILDEPTSALSPPEAKRLFEFVARLRACGVAIAFISHFIEDVLAICDRVTVLKDGEVVDARAAAEFDKHAVIRSMLGHGLRSAEPGYEAAVSLPPRSNAPPLLTAARLTRHGAFRGIDLQVARGECLGLYGFVGAGHQELANCLAGAMHFDEGQVTLDEAPLRPNRLHEAIRRGVALVAADRQQTLFHRAEVYKNATLAHLRNVSGEWLLRRRETRAVDPILRRVGCTPPLPRLLAGHLSGGNQQKVVLAKWLFGPVRVLVLDEPTRGMDVGAKEEIMRLVAGLKREGTAVILSSSEPEMVLAHADRILVLNRGQVAKEFVGEQVDKAALMREA